MTGSANIVRVRVQLIKPNPGIKSHEREQVKHCLASSVSQQYQDVFMTNLDLTFYEREKVKHWFSASKIKGKSLSGMKPEKSSQRLGNCSRPELITRAQKAMID